MKTREFIAKLLEMDPSGEMPVVSDGYEFDDRYYLATMRAGEGVPGRQLLNAEPRWYHPPEYGGETVKVVVLS